jgi:hypothetical protein
MEMVVMGMVLVFAGRREGTGAFLCEKSLVLKKKRIKRKSKIAFAAAAPGALGRLRQAIRQTRVLCRCPG